MYKDDHPPPHFHIAFRDGKKVSVDLETLEVSAGKVDSWRLKTPMEWARMNHNLLWEKWKELSE